MFVKFQQKDIVISSLCFYELEMLSSEYFDDAFILDNELFDDDVMRRSDFLKLRYHFHFFRMVTLKFSSTQSMYSPCMREL